MKAFTEHLANVLPTIEEGTDIDDLLLNIAIEYQDWKEQQEEEVEVSKQYDQRLADDLTAYAQSVRVL